MNRLLIIILTAIMAAGCSNHGRETKRVVVARAGNEVLYLDQVPLLLTSESTAIDSAGIINEYVNKWAKKQFLYQKAVENLSPELKDEIERQLENTRMDLIIYQYQRQMMLEKMDTVVTDAEMQEYFSSNQESFYLGTNIIKSLFIKLPSETPDINRIRQLAHSNDQQDLQQLESICYQFADKFDDFDEKWIPFNRLLVELPSDISNEENFLRRTTFYETKDSSYIYFITIRDFRLRSTLAPFDYVSDDIKRIIWNNRRIEFIRALENGIYNDALKENDLTIYNND